MTRIEAFLKVIIDGQAWLYAQFFKLQSELMGRTVDQPTFEKWEDEWKATTRQLVEGLTDGFEEE